MFITAASYLKILCVPAHLQSETGGILGGRNQIIDRVCLDSGVYSAAGSFTYTPNSALLNRCIQHWHFSNRSFMGVFHTHPNKPGYDRLSCGDIDYITFFMAVNPDFSILYLPIIIPGICMIPYYAIRSNGQIQIQKDSVHIL